LTPLLQEIRDGDTARNPRRTHRGRKPAAELFARDDGQDVPQLNEAADLVPKDTKIAITFLPTRTSRPRGGRGRVRELGFVPVPASRHGA
jgi:hypothetical protein